MPDAVPLRQVTRQRKQQKRCRLALSRKRPATACGSQPTESELVTQSVGSASDPSGHRRAGCRRNAVCYRANHTAGLDLQIRKRQPLGLSLLCGSKPLSSLTSEMQAPQRTHTIWRWRAEPDLRSDKPVEAIVVQYDGVAIQSPDILGGCIRPGEATTQIERHRRYRDCSYE